MAGQYSLILATDYNAIQAKVALVLGSGSGNTGYGQPLSSSQINSKINVTLDQWANLRSDLLKVRQHQTGADLSSALAVPTRARNITETDRAAYLQMANDIAIEANRLVTPPIGQGSRSALVPTQQRTTAWNGDISQTITVTFPTADAARYFFNTGGQIEFSAERYGGTANTKNNTWTSMFSHPPSSGMGVISFNHNSTTMTGTGINAGSIGWYQLLSSDQLIFEKDAPSGTYAANRYLIYAKSPSPNTLIFTIRFQDDTTGFQDEDVDGTLNSIVQVYRASGSNVSVSVPPAVSSGIGSGSTPLMTIGPSTIDNILQVGTNYVFNFVTVGGTQPYTYTYSGTLPAGMTLSPTGALGGAPTTVNSYTFYITSTDFNNYVTSKSYTITTGIATVIIDNPTQVSPLRIGTPYSTTIQASGGTAPYIYSTTGPLPPGLTLSPAGLLSGTPTTPNVYSFIINATDNQGYLGSRTYTSTVPAALTGVSPTVFTADVATLSTVVFAPTGGVAPYTFVQSGVLPTGMTLSNGTNVNTITLSGTPTTVTSSQFQLAITDSAGQTVTKSVDWVVAALPVKTYSVTPSVSSVNEGGSVTFTINTTNFGSGVLYWAITGGCVGADFTGGNISGVIDVQNNVGIITKALANDLTTEGLETFNFEVRTTAGGSPVASTTISVADTSLSPVVTYSLAANVSTTTEGSAIQYTVITQNVGNATLYWKASGGGISPSDFTDSLIEGSVTVTGDFGVFTRSVRADVTTEGTEQLIMNLLTGGVNGTTRSTATVSITDSSQAPPPPVSYTIVPSSTTMTESGSYSVTFTINTTNVANGTQLYWNTLGTGVTAADFLDGTVSGIVTINNNTGTITRIASADLTTEGSESYVLQLKQSAGSVETLATSSSITITDTSAAPTPSGTVVYGTLATHDTVLPAWIVPAGVTAVRATVVGGGGGGGSSYRAENQAGGGGGGAGGAIRQVFAVSPGDPISIIVGSKGIGATGVDNSEIANTRTTQPINAASIPVTSSYWGSFMNSYAIWASPASAGAIDFSYTLVFPYTGNYTFEYSADNTGTIEIDGSVVITLSNGFTSSTTQTLFVSAGSKTIRIRAVNAGTYSVTNPAGVGLSIRKSIASAIATAGNRSQLTKSGVSLIAYGGSRGIDASANIAGLGGLGGSTSVSGTSAGTNVYSTSGPSGTSGTEVANGAPNNGAATGGTGGSVTGLSAGGSGGVGDASGQDGNGYGAGGGGGGVAQVGGVYTKAAYSGGNGDTGGVLLEWGPGITV